VTSLATIRPALAKSFADTVETRKSRNFAKPTTNEAPGEFIRLSWCEDLAKGASQQLVFHLAISIGGSLQGISLESGVMNKLLEAQLGTPLLNDTHITIRLHGFRGWCGSLLGGRGRRSRSLDSGSRCLNGGLRWGRRGSVSFGDSSVNDLGLRPVLLDHLGCRSGCGSIADDDGDDGSLVYDFDFVDHDVLVSSVATVGSGERGARKREDGESLDSVHVDCGVIE